MRKHASKRVAVILAVALIITALVPVSVQAGVGDEFAIDNARYRVLTEASGATMGTVVLYEYIPSVGDVFIPLAATNTNGGQVYTVTEIGEEAFLYKDITSVSYASGTKLEKIGIRAFEECEYLTSILIPASVKNIYKNALSYCASLANVTFEPGSQLETIGEQAFARNPSLRSIVIPANVFNIESEAFTDCESLTNVTFEPGSKLNSIGMFAFADCISLQSVVLPASLTRINEAAFRGTAIKSIDIPANVVHISASAFMDCDNLSEIRFNSHKAPTIGNNVFKNVAKNGVIYYPENGVGYDEAFFNMLFGGSVPPGWRDDEPSAPSVSEPVNESAEVPEAEIPGFGRDFSVSGEVTNAPGVPESVKLRVSSPSPEFTSNKAANAAYSDALLYGQPVAFCGLGLADAVSGQAYALPEGAVVRLAFELGAAYADQGVTISQYDVNGALIERFNVTCDGDGAVVINANGLGLFVITQEWI